MNNPTRARLAVFRGAIRSLNNRALGELRERFVDLGSPASTIAAIDRELEQRKRADTAAKIQVLGGAGGPLSDVPALSRH